MAMSRSSGATGRPAGGKPVVRFSRPLLSAGLARPGPLRVPTAALVLTDDVARAPPRPCGRPRVWAWPSSRAVARGLRIGRYRRSRDLTPAPVPVAEKAVELPCGDRVALARAALETVAVGGKAAGPRPAPRMARTLRFKRQFYSPPAPCQRAAGGLMHTVVNCTGRAPVVVAVAVSLPGAARAESASCCLLCLRANAWSGNPRRLTCRWPMRDAGPVPHHRRPAPCAARASPLPPTTARLSGQAPRPTQGEQEPLRPVPGRDCRPGDAPTRASRTPRGAPVLTNLERLRLVGSYTDSRPGPASPRPPARRSARPPAPTA
jgi:hypothetical protein